VLIQKLHQHDEDVEESPQDALASLAARHGADGINSEPASSPATETP